MSQTSNHKKKGKSQENVETLCNENLREIWNFLCFKSFQSFQFHLLYGSLHLFLRSKFSFHLCDFDARFTILIHFLSFFWHKREPLLTLSDRVAFSVNSWKCKNILKSPMKNRKCHLLYEKLRCVWINCWHTSNTCNYFIIVKMSQRAMCED